MKTLAIGMLQSLLRGLLWGGATWLVQHSLWTQGDAEKYVEAAALVLASLAWSFYEKHSSRKEVLTALIMPVGATENDVKAHIAKGAPTPPITTPPDSIPAPVSALPVSKTLL